MSHIWYCYQQQGASFNRTDFSSCLFISPPSLQSAEGIAGEPQFCCALSEIEDASNPHLWGTKHLAPLSMVPGKASYRSKRDRVSEVQTTEGVQYVQRHIYCLFW